MPEPQRQQKSGDFLRRLVLPSRTFCEVCAHPAHSVLFFSLVRRIRHESPHLPDCVYPNPKPTPPPIFLIKSKPRTGRPRKYVKTEARKKSA